MTCLLPRLRHPLPPTYPVDFNVYYSAAQLVRHGDAAALYDGADTGANPQKLIAPASSPLFQAAHAEGLVFVGLYVYPPILADLLVPFASLHVKAAQTLWLAVNGGFLVLIAWLTTLLLRLPVLGWRTLLILVSVACFTPVLQCLHDGQITIFLLLLWVTGMVLYQRNRVAAAAVVFALAAAIKLTPVLVLVPFLIWRRWKFVGVFLGSLLLFVVLSLWVDSPHASHVYLTRVLPAMSGPLPALTNYSLAAAAERVLEICKHGALAPFPESLSPAIALAGRAFSTAVLLAAVALMARARHVQNRESQILVLGLLGLLAPLLSPVSWFHAYATAFVAFALLWRDCLQRNRSGLYLVLLTAVTLLLGTAGGENAIASLAGSPLLQNFASYLQLAQLAAACWLCLYHLRKLGDGSSQQHGLGIPPPPEAGALPA